MSNEIVRIHDSKIWHKIADDTSYWTVCGKYFIIDDIEYSSLKKLQYTTCCPYDSMSGLQRKCKLCFKGEFNDWGFII